MVIDEILDELRSLGREKERIEKSFSAFSKLMSDADERALSDKESLAEQYEAAGNDQEIVAILDEKKATIDQFRTRCADDLEEIKLKYQKDIEAIENREKDLKGELDILSREKEEESNENNGNSTIC